MNDNTSTHADECVRADAGSRNELGGYRPLSAAIDDIHGNVQRVAAMYECEHTLFAYELHDGIVHYLVGAIMMEEQALQLLRAHAFDSAHEKLTRSSALLRNAVDEARRMIDRRRPGALEQLGLVEAVRQLVAQGKTQYGIECTFVEDGDFAGLPAPLETAVFRIVQEALSNSLRHSTSSAVLVSIAQRDGRLCLKVEDWGVGFDPESVEAKAAGLEGIRHRAQLFGGCIKIRSSPGKGTLIKVRWPVQERVRDDG